MMDNSNFNRVQAVINLDNIRDNITAMKRLIDGDKKMLAVIKADAYGHGAVEVAEALDDLVDFFAVAFIDEALELRRANIDKPILILGYTDPSDYELILRYDVRPAMYEVDDAQKLSDLAVSMNTKAKIHIKVDTGMGRIGFTCDEDGVKNIEKISQMPGIEIEGIFTHYAKADELDKTAANGQLEKFRWINSQLEALGIHIPVRHISNSAGIMEMDNSDFDMVRSGIVTYGLYPSDEVDKNIAAYNDKDIIDFVKELGSFDQYIMISSSAVYPEYGVQPFLEESEKSENKFWDAYGTDKIAAEKALLERVKDAYILRPPYLYGPMNNVYREAFVFDCALADRKFYLPQDGGMKLQFFHVKDLCRLMEVIIKEKPEEHILNVGNVEAVSIKDWVTKCYESLGKIPNFVNVYEEIEQRNYFSFYNYEYYLDVSRQSKIYPETISLEDGLRDSVKWYLEHRTEVNKKPYFEYINENLVER